MIRVLAASLAAIAAVALGSCGGGGDTTIVKSIVSQPTASTSTSTTTTTSSTGTGGPSTTTPAEMSHYQSFQAASGNIGCIVNAGTVRCDVRNRSWNPPDRPASCPSEVDFGQGVEVGGGPAELVCAGDTALNPTAPSLAPGKATSRGEIVCTAIANLITCVDKSTGHGFDMSSASYKLF